MHTMTVTLRTVTPLFLGGARTVRVAGKESIEADARVPPIKSALRFWFRFAEGGRQGGSWQKVKGEEDRLFGGQERGVGVFRIRLSGTPPRVTPLPAVPPWYKEWPLSIMYMGYGCATRRKLDEKEKERRNKATPRIPTQVFEPARSFIDAGELFEFDLLFTADSQPDDRRKIYEALWLWTHLGGFGSRARRGWGSLQLIEPNAGHVPAPSSAGDCETLRKAIEKGIAEIIPDTPPTTAEYTHWFAGAKVLVPKIQSNWQESMKWIGDKFIAFRSNSTKFKVPRPGPGDHCWPDHDLLRNYLLPRGNGYVSPTNPPVRAVFGLPQNYGFGGLAQGSKAQNPNKATVKARFNTRRSDGSIAEEVIDRRASPLLIRLHPVQNGVAVVITVVPSTFLPKQNGGAEIRFEPVYDDPGKQNSLPIGHRPPIEHTAPPTDWQTLNQFLATL